MPILSDRRDLLIDLIQQSGWFPIEINVPDTISLIGQGVGNIGEGINTVGQGISSSVMNFGDNFQNWIQTVPLLNRFTNYFRPKPNSLIVWVPFKRPNLQFNPFDSTSDVGLIPVYP